MTDSGEQSRHRLTGRLLLFGTFAALLLILLMTFLVDRSIRNIWLGELDNDLATVAATARVALPDDPAGYQTWAREVSEAAGVRLTLIDSTGEVRADSQMDPGVMENHRTRVEVQTALDGQVGKVTRVSATTGISERYVATPVEDGLVVRVSTATSMVESELNQTRSAITRVSLVVAVVALGSLAFLGRRVARPITELADQAMTLAGGDLAIRPAPSSVVELDRLGKALTAISDNLGGRVAEAERAQSLLEVVLGSIPQGTVLFDGEDRVVYANPAARQILGVVPETLTHLAPFQLQVAVRDARSQAATEVREVDHGIPARRLRGTATPFVDDPRVLLVVVDITERERIDSIRRDFVANASHELKTPVATIIASSEAMQIALSRADQSAELFASRVESSARQLERLVADLLDLSRLERESPDMTAVRLDVVLAEEVDRVRSRIADNDLELTVESEEVSVLANRRDVGIATKNLIDNAIRYTPAGGRISVRLIGRDGTAELSVADTGDGIPSKDISRIFERFYRVDAARSRQTGGTGLGLAIVRHVAESHGGTVAVESELGRGSTFTVTLPLLNGEAPTDQ